MSDKGIKRQHNPISLSEHFDEYEIFCSCVDDAAVPLLLLLSKTSQTRAAV